MKDTAALTGWAAGERWGAASGFAMVAFGAAAAVFERSPETAADFAAHRGALQTQSMLFLAGAALSLVFLASLRSYLRLFERGTGWLASAAFGGGIAWAALNMTAQALQIGVAADRTAGAPNALITTMRAVFAVANLPLAVMLLAVAIVSLRFLAFPRWLGWLSAVAATAQTLLWCAAPVQSGPLAANGWLSTVLYPFFLIWLIPATVVMVRTSSLKAARLGRYRPSGRDTAHAGTHGR